ncbi:MAG: DUF3789 domain-containing protein [Ruminococcus sp.]|nr:DUF3789 domain-containing protein [Ruminococcus sp.]
MLLGFIIGLFIGAAVGVFAMCLMIISRDED